MNRQSSESDRDPPQGPNPGGEQRQFHRQAVRWEAGGDFFVLDISPGGAKVQVSEPPAAETQVALVLEPGGRFSGKVAWQQGSTFGISFNRTHDDFLAA